MSAIIDVLSDTIDLMQRSCSSDASGWTSVDEEQRKQNGSEGLSHVYKSTSSNVDGQCNPQQVLH